MSPRGSALCIPYTLPSTRSTPPYLNASPQPTISSFEKPSDPENSQKLFLLGLTTCQSEKSVFLLGLSESSGYTKWTSSQFYLGPLAAGESVNHCFWDSDSVTEWVLLPLHVTGESGFEGL